MLRYPASMRLPASPFLRALAAALCIAALAACESPIRVTTDRDPVADFSDYETFAWISDEPLISQTVGVTEGPRISPIDDQRIREAVGYELRSRGWKQASSREEADLIVSYGIGAEERTEIYETPVTGGYYYGGYRYGGWYAGSTVRTRQVTEGTLSIEFFDRETKQAVWVGWASKRLSPSGDEDRDRVIGEAIQKIMQDFPSAS